MIHTHLHTVYSLLDGYAKIDDLIEKAKEYNMPAIAITDHGTLGGTFEFNKKCKANNIKPLLGCEVYHTLDRHEICKPIDERKEDAWNKFLTEYTDDTEELNKLKKKEREQLAKPYMYDTKGYHLILIAKNQEGWNNLVKITSIANDEGNFNGRGHIDYDLLEQYHEGLICTTACMSGMIPVSILRDEEEKAIENLNRLYKIFKDDLYLEVQPLTMKEQIKINKQLIKYSNKYDIKLVSANDVHYTNKDDNYEHDVLLCIGTKKLYNDTDRMKYDHEFWFRNEDEMLEAYKRNGYTDEELQAICQAINNTDELANKVEDNIQVGSKKELLPDVIAPENYTSKSWLRQQCWNRLYNYLSENNLMDKREIYEARLNEELRVIISKGFDTYMLIVQQMIQQGEQAGFSFGPGRGSAAGCLVAFLLGICKGIDPIEYDLLFFRFLTETRTANPDMKNL